MKQRVILHCDVNNFFASVECALNPSLKDLPIAVSGEVQKRNGIILAKNNIAKQFGIQTGEVIWKAKQKCPDLICVRPHHNKYIEYSNKIRKIYEDYTDKVEPFSIDECFLDITDTMKFFGTPKEVADKIRARVKDEIGVSISVGVSFSKIFAKLGSDMKKPDATTLIPYENFKSITYNLPLKSVIGVGKSTEKSLNKLNIFTLGEFANFDNAIIKQKLGIVGEKLQTALKGIGDNEVASIGDKRDVKSIGNGTTTLVDIKTISEMKTVVMFLCDKIATRLRQKKFVGSTISVSLRKSDLTWISKSHTILSATNTANDIFDGVMLIISKMWQSGTYIRSIRISLSNLSDENSVNQLNFFSNKTENKQKLDKAIDTIRKKYGYLSISPLITKNPEILNPDAVRLDDKD